MGLRIMNIEDTWSSRPWSELTGEERIATVRLFLKEAALGLDERGGTSVLRDSIERMLEDMAPDVTRPLDRVINPAEGPAPEAVATLQRDLSERANEHRDFLDIKAEAGTY